MPTETSKAEHILRVIAAGLLAFLFVWFEFKLLLLAFAGFLLSILLHAIADWVSRHTALRPLFAYLATLALIAAIVVLAAFLLVPRVINQVSQAAALIPQALTEAKAYLHQTMWGTSILHVLERTAKGTGAQLTWVATEIVRGTVDVIVIAVIGFFGALNPRGYRDGLLSLVPAAKRAKARTIADHAASTLRSWLLGQLVPMAVLGVASMVGLWLLGVPLAFTLGLLTGLMIFVPYIGSISSGLLAILLGFRESPHTALYVFLLYCVFHLTEGYLLTPLVQKKAVRLPPILTVLAQFFLWSVAGILGVAVAAPLAAVGLRIVKSLYLSPASSSSALAPQPERS